MNTEKWNKNVKRFENYIRRTGKNKIFAIAMFMIGYLSAKMFEDWTVFIIFLALFVIPAFFAKDNCIK